MKFKVLIQKVVTHEVEVDLDVEDISQVKDSLSEELGELASEDSEISCDIFVYDVTPL